MDDLGGGGIVGEGRVDSEEEGVESAEADGVHAFGLGDGVVFEEFSEEDLDRGTGTARLLSFSS